MADEKETNESKKEKLRETIKQLIFEGHCTQDVEYAGRKWTFKTLTPKDMNKVFGLSKLEKNPVAYSYTYKLEILKLAIVMINDIEVSEDSREMFDELPPKIIDELYDKYIEIARFLVATQEDREIITDIAENDDLSKMRFTVMKEFHALPTEQRVKDLNEHQLVWLYHNILQQEKEHHEQDYAKIDYLAFFVNPEIHKKVMEAREHQKSSKNSVSKNGVQIVEEHDEVNPYNESMVTHYGATTVDEDFEMKLKMFTDGSQPMTELDSDTQKGNSYESKEDFLARALQMNDIIQNENEKKLQEDAKQSGVNADELDMFEVD